ncbi:hypothetical protein BDY17DRAFT_297454 [Neohortaea acidophila]|uniref:Uncharacterized protein n=1 Tax=Neohortaea acidophila TaxID=245834 RepID=A0A6A6PTM6_9PEZI|nr:uncharacterized protein BDY17DRAFT_297454 [Neohortaea acidophila]KAF2483458.1 hypothetical protein BDY17DRAFT_297454 [Neohortaea acidophila]
MRLTTLILAILGTAAASPKSPRGGDSWHGSGDSWPGCSKAVEQVYAAHQQSQATAFCSWYYPARWAPTVTKTTTKTIHTSTTITRTTSVAATSIVTSCAVPATTSSTTTPVKREAHQTPKPQAWSHYPLGPSASSCCKCLHPATSTIIKTITKTAVTSTASVVHTVTTSTTTVNAVQTFSLYEVGSNEGNSFLNPRQQADEFFLVGNILNPTNPATYTLLGNGSLVIVYPGPSNPASTAGRIAVQQIGEVQTYFVIFTDGVSSNTSVLTCAVATDVDGTCPFTCSVSGVEAGAVFYNYNLVEDIVSIGPSVPVQSEALTLYAVGSAPATAGNTTKLLDDLT